VPGDCHGKAVKAWAWVNLVSAVHVVSTLIELCTLLWLHVNLIAIKMSFKRLHYAVAVKQEVIV
jgi:hypothetical protein